MNNGASLMKTILSILMLSALPLLALAGGDHAGGHDHRAHGWVAPQAEIARRNPVRADAASVRRGGKLYREQCASCHGPTGRGDGPAGRALKPAPADLVAHGAHHSDGDLAWKIRSGRGAMPGFGTTLTDTQIWDVVNYLRTLAPAPKAAGEAHDHKH